jgi:GST-like protein
MLAQPVKYLYSAEYAARRQPNRSTNTMVIGRRQFKRFGLHVTHSDSTCLADNLILQDMIDLYYWPTPNGHKISIMLEECGLPYNTIPVRIGQGDQFAADFLKIAPNNRIPAIVDNDTGVSVFEGGAILIYLAEKASMLLPNERDQRAEVLQWLFWQAGGLGPMAGQLSHFVNYTREAVPYAHQRYADEYDRLLAVMDVRLRDREFLGGDYSIADIASFPWVLPYKRLGNDLDKFENLRRWFDALKQRPAVRKGIDLGKDWKRSEKQSDAARSIMFKQNAETVFKAADAAGK